MDPSVTWTTLMSSARHWAQFFSGVVYELELSEQTISETVNLVGLSRKLISGAGQLIGNVQIIDFDGWKLINVVRKTNF